MQRCRVDFRCMTELTSTSRPAELTGLEHMQAIADGTIAPAPIAELLGFELIEAEHGRALLAALPTERVYNPIGSVHGGFAATLLDSAMGCAVQTTLPAGVGYTTLELKVNYVRAARAGMRLVADAEVVHRGRTVATAEARLRDEASGKLLAHATTTCLVIGA